MAILEPTAAATDRDLRWLPPVLGVLAGLAVLGPGLRPGLLLNLDLVAVPELRLPPGMWGLGPALTQRVPLGALEAWAAAVLGGPSTVKLLVVAAIAGAYVGMERLARPASPISRHGAALLYAIGPYTVTRAAIGHLNVLWAVAVLPWALPALLRPSRSPRRTFAALALLGLGGTASAVLGLAVVAVGLAMEHRRRPTLVALAAGTASLPWLVPNLVVIVLGASVGGSGSFRTDLPDPGGAARLLIGAGFWIPRAQVGGRGAVAVVSGLVLLGLAAAGARALPAAWRHPGVAAAAVGLVAAAASGLPGLGSAWDVVADTAVAAPLREGQRFLLLWLVVSLPAAAHGADRLAQRVAPALAPAVLTLPLAVALVLGAPVIGGAEGGFEPRHLPAGWSGATREVAAEPGTTLVLPWHLYYRASFADDRTILNPGPDVIGGDTISSFDPEVGGGQEQLDTRWRKAARILEGYRQGRAGAARLAALGVRWVFVPQEYDWAVSGRALADDPGLRPVDVGEGVLLYEVEGWKGPLRLPGGGSAAVGGPVAPLRSVPRSGGTWAFPATAGWLRGLEPARVTNDGLLAVPVGGGPLWYWPAVPIVLGDITTAAMALALGVSWRRRRLLHGLQHRGTEERQDVDRRG